MISNLLQSLVANPWALPLAIVILGISIFVHELGHFLAARRRGVLVERFSIGFGPKIISWRGKDGVDYRLSLIPLGGYVLLPQLADLGPIEGQSTTDLTKLKPISYSTKMIVFVAGATFNVIFAFLLATVLWVVGQPVIQEDLNTIVGGTSPVVETTRGNVVPGPAATAGIQPGDRIITVDNIVVKSFNDILELVALGSGRDAQANPQVTVVYEHAGQQKTVLLQPILTGEDKIRSIGLEPSVKVGVEVVQPDSAAAAAGLRADDELLSLDGHPITYTSFISDYIRLNPGKNLSLRFKRDGVEQTISFAPKAVVEAPGTAPVYRLGVQLHGVYNITTVHTPPWVMIGQQLRSTWRTVCSLVNKNSDIGLSKMSGPIGIVRILHNAAEVGVRAVILITILINVNLAIFNLLPIPVLDGGQMLFATIARLRRRALPANFIMSTQGVFMVLILLMIVYVSFFDVSRIVRDNRAELPVPAVEQKK